MEQEELEIFSTMWHTQDTGTPSPALRAGFLAICQQGPSWTEAWKGLSSHPHEATTKAGTGEWYDGSNRALLRVPALLLVVLQITSSKQGHRSSAIRHTGTRCVGVTPNEMPCLGPLLSGYQRGERHVPCPGASAACMMTFLAALMSGVGPWQVTACRPSLTSARLRQSSHPIVSQTFACPRVSARRKTKRAPRAMWSDDG